MSVVFNYFCYMIAQNLENILKNIPSSVQLVAVTKTHPAEVIMEVYRWGHKVFGENRVQELLSKQTILPSDVQWHLIGHLQTNKVKFIIPFIHLIHSVDSFKLLREINKEAAKAGKTIDCLLQIYIAREDTKFGLNEKELNELLTNPEIPAMNNVRICGLMGIATYTEDMEQVRQEFRGLKKLFDQTKKDFFSTSEYFKDISMGMSHDYTLAIEEGSTMVRIGTSIFGERDYPV